MDRVTLRRPQKQGLAQCGKTDLVVAANKSRLLENDQYLLMPTVILGNP